MVVSNVGFFYHGFTPESCGRYHLAAPALKGTLSITTPHWYSWLTKFDSGPDDGLPGNPEYSVSPRYIAFLPSLMVRYRTYGIAQGNPWIKWILLSTYILGAAVRFLRPSAMLPVLILK